MKPKQRRDHILSLDGRHDGFGHFGAPTGTRMRVVGITHAEWGPWRLQTEITQVDEVAVWKQIEMQTLSF